MRIRSGTPILYISFVAAAIVTLGLTGAFLYLMWRQDKATLGFTLAMTPFLLMGGLLAFLGARGLWQLKLHGTWELDVPDEGGRLGTPLHVTLVPQRPVATSGELQYRLRCVRSVRTQVRGTQGTSGRADHATLWRNRGRSGPAPSILTRGSR